jgi:nitrite reductase/ring-hydroxylating ferredoxin subunit
MTKDNETGDRGAAPARAKGPSIQELLDEEVVEVPWVLRQERSVDLGSEDLPADRYLSEEFFEREAEKLWPRVWQLACFEQDIPDVGDAIVYDILDWSFLVVRSAPDTIQAFYNACLHRGRQLRTNTDRAAACPELRCPFHGLAWNLDGSFKQIPSSIAWDFAHVRPADLQLPEVRCETWDGLVFINMDRRAQPLLDFLGDLTTHFERWPFKDRWKFAHVAKVVAANWKVVIDAFIESMHVIATHPQMNAGLLGGDGSNCEYDVYESFSRSIMAPPMPNPNLPYAVTEAQLIESMVYGGAPADDRTVPEGMTTRRLLAELGRGAGTTTAAGGPLTVMEATAAIWYYVFPNWFPWSGPIFYRFRPYRRDRAKTVMECMLLAPVGEGQERPPAAPVHWLAEDDDWTEAPELGGLAQVFNQDIGNIPYVQRGLHSLVRGKPSRGLTLANYQDVRIRHYHALLDRYLDA